MPEMARLPEPVMVYIYAVLDGFQIIYVGMTDNLIRRAAQHRATSEWCKPHHEFVVLSKHLPSVARRAETSAIRKHRPRFNVQNNPTPLEMRIASIKVGIAQSHAGMVTSLDDVVAELGIDEAKP